MRKLPVIKGRTFGSGTPVVCVPIVEKDKDSIIAEAKRLVSIGVEAIEWRVDLFENYSSPNAIREVLAGLKPVVKDTILMFTYRTRPQGGNGEYRKEMIGEINMVAAESGVVDIVDQEYFASGRNLRSIRAIQKLGVLVLVSHHDFDETPDAGVIRMLLEEEYESGADIVKLALWPNSVDDVLTLLSETAYFHENHPDIPLITMSMGPLGSISRVTGETFGSCLTFGAGLAASGPGQLPEDKLRQLLKLIHESMYAE